MVKFLKHGFLESMRLLTDSGLYYFCEKIVLNLSTR